MQLFFSFGISFAKQIKRKNSTITLYLKYRYLKAVIFFSIVLNNFVFSQNDSIQSDEFFYTNDSIVSLSDSMLLLSRFKSSNASDTLSNDTTISNAQKKEVLEDIVEYHADDSIIVSLNNNKIYLYKNSNINYTNIKLTSGYIEFDMDKSEVFAKGLTDTSGNVTGSPVFNQGSETFESKELRYNFDSRKGMISQIITQEGEGYLHSEKTKRHASGQIHIHKGKYTTCDLDHPHFYVALNKAIAIPEDKIISKAAYMVLADIPLPIIVPFGWFPNTPNKSSGLLFPSTGYEERRGYYLRDLGWYFPLSDHYDLKLYSDIYSRGSWAGKLNSSYKKRYRFNGSVNIEQYHDKFGDAELGESIEEITDFRFSWSHRQAPQANPNQNFSANIDLKSTSYNKNQTTDLQSFGQNTNSSGISYSRNRPGSLFNFTTRMNHSQNVTTGKVDATLPEASLNMRNIYPFKSKTNPTGSWYEQINFSYKANFKNSVSMDDSLFFTEELFNEMQYGFKHDAPLSTNIQVLKLINISPSVSYSGVWSPDIIQKYYEYVDNDTIADLVTDTISQSTYAHSIRPSLSVSVQKKIFGMYQSTNPNSDIIAVRHMMTPSVGISYTPDVSRYMPNYNETYITPDGEVKEYSKLDHAVFRVPVSSNKESAVINFALKNNVEMKLRSDNDSTETTRKVSIIESLNFSGSYNLTAEGDSMHLSTIKSSASTKLFKNLLSLSLNSTHDPYALNPETGHRVKEFEINVTDKWARLTNATMSASFRLDAKKFRGESKEAEEEENETQAQDVYGFLRYLYPELYLPGTYADFSLPWNLDVSFSWSYSKPAFKRTLREEVSFGGGFNLSDNWKINIRSGYDFISKDITYSTINVTRDLHCWQMTFNVVPFGTYRSYNFTIRAKASILQDLKYEKKKTRYEFQDE